MTHRESDNRRHEEDSKISRDLDTLQGLLNLSPYELRCFSALLGHDQLPAQRLAQEAGVPRSRVYDILRKLSARGLIIEAPGRPTHFSLVDPQFGFASCLGNSQREVLTKMDQQRQLLASLANSLSSYHGSVLHARTSREMGWTIGTEAAAMAHHIKLKHSCQESYSGISESSTVPPDELFAVERQMLKRGIEARLIRTFPPNMPAHQKELYRDLQKEGFQIRVLKTPEISFDVFDHRDVLLWLDEGTGRAASGITWIRHASLAKVLETYFDTVWESALPARV